MDAAVVAGTPYELVGLVYFVFFLLMGRKQYAGVYTQRSRVLTLLAAIVMVGGVPFGYAGKPVAIDVIIVLAIVAVASSMVDAIKSRRRP